MGCEGMGRMGMHIWDFPPAKYSCSHCPGKFLQKSSFISHINRRKRENQNANPTTERRPPDFPNQGAQIEEVNKNNLLIEICVKCITVYYT